MSLTKVLIKFVSPYPAGNVISAAALKPELMIPVGYGSFMTDTMRGRYNYFFHQRQLETIVAEPVQLEQYLMGDIETRLERLLTRYESRRPVVDISDADPIETMALGTVLRAHKYWSVTVLDYRVRDSVFLPLRNGDFLQQLSFPNLTEAELRYLRDGTPMDEARAYGEILSRKDLNRHVIREIRSLSILYAEGPAYWRDVVSRLRYAVSGKSEDRTEYLIDTSQLGIRDSALEDLRDAGILKEYVRRSGIVRIVFPDKYAVQLLMHIERIPMINIFLAVAFVREYGRAAAYHDLMLRDYACVTGIHDCLPVAVAIFSEQDGAEQIYRFHMKALSYYDEPVRKILVRFGQTGLSDDIKEAADRFGVEIIPMKRLAESLEPR